MNTPQQPKKDYKKLLRRRWREAGLCVTCGKPPSSGSRCDDCRKRDAAKKRGEKAERRKAGRCAVCGKVETANWRCPECQAKENEKRHGREAARTPEEAAADLEHKVAGNRYRRYGRRIDGLCARCGKGSKKYLCPECYKWHRERHNAYRRKARDEAVAAYGGRCACCGETEPLFLTIDHVNGDGAAHRKLMKPSGQRVDGSKIYYWLKKNGYPAGFQVLCFNCNCGRNRIPDKVCPHQRKV